MDKAWVIREVACRCCGRGGHTSYPGVTFDEAGYIRLAREARAETERTGRRHIVAVVGFTYSGQAVSNPWRLSEDERARLAGDRLMDSYY